MLSVLRNHRRSRLAQAKLWLAGLGLWSASIGLLGTAEAQQPYTKRQTIDEEMRSIDQLIDGEIVQTGLRRRQDANNPLPAATGPAGSGNYTYSTTAPAEESSCWQGEFWSLTSVFDDDCGGNRLRDRRINVGGSIINSMTFNTDAPKDKFNGPVTWTDRANEWQMNQAWFYAEKALNMDCDIDFGFRADVMYGTNFRFNTATGLEDNINGSHSFYGVAFPQFYAQTKYYDWIIKSGHWVSPVGYFTVDMSQNFFNTLPYTYQYGEPFTHTGTIVSRNINDSLNVGIGGVRGWDNFDNTTPNFGGIATMTKTFENGGSLAWVGLLTQEQTQNLDFKKRFLQTVVYSKNLTDRVTYVGQSDFGWQKDALVNGSDAYWYGLNQYLIYKMNDCWSFGSNFEWFRDQDGYRVGGFLPNTYAVPGSQVRGLSTARSGYRGNFYQITLGPKWTPTKNFMVRPNLRFDWFDGEIDNPGKLKPYDDGLKNAQTIFGTDFVITY